MTVLVCYTVRVIPSYHSPRLIVQSSDCIISFYCILIFQCVRTKHTWLKPEIYSWKPCNSHWADSDSHKQPTGKGVQWKYHLKQTATTVCKTVTVNISPICSHNCLCHWNASMPYEVFPVQMQASWEQPAPKDTHLNCGNLSISTNRSSPFPEFYLYSKCLKRYQSGKWMRV